MEPGTDGASHAPGTTLAVGRAGRIEAVPLTAAGDNAVLVRESDAAGRARALLTTDKLPVGERLVIMPLDDEVEVRVDGDALAVWLGAGSLRQLPAEQQPMPTSVPSWATIVGGFLLVLVVAFALIGSAVSFGWLAELLT